VCGAYGHMYEDCFLLEKSEEIDHAGIHVLPIEDIVMRDDDWVHRHNICFRKLLPLSYLLMLREANPPGVTRK